MSEREPGDQDENAPDGWSDLSDEERAALETAFDQAEENHRQGRSISRDDVLPRYRRAG